MCVNLKAFLQYLSMKVICHCLHTKTKLQASVAPKSLKLRRTQTPSPNHRKPTMIDDDDDFKPTPTMTF
jgi:hypothetical protein